MKDLGGRVAVITGGASGIGLAAARCFAEAGMKLALADTDRATLDKATAELHAAGFEAIGIVTDVGERGDLERLADTVWERFGGAHVLVNNAGVAVYGAAQSLQPSDWEWSLRVNLWGVINGVGVFLPRFLAQGAPAHIVNTASLAGLVPSQSMAAYNTAKAAVVSLTESLHKDLRGTPVGVTVVCPMRVATGIWHTSAHNRPAALGGAAAFRKRTEEETNAMAGSILDAGTVGRMIVEAVETGRLYLVTHAEARAYIRRRWERLDASFDA